MRRFACGRHPGLVRPKRATGRGHLGPEDPERGSRVRAVLIPVISANTMSRREGYFRLEWDLAVRRTRMIASGPRPDVIVPVCAGLDATAEAGADVPESFHRAQWTRLPGGDASVAFVERVRRLLNQALPDAEEAGSVRWGRPWRLGVPSRGRGQPHSLRSV